MEDPSSTPAAASNPVPNLSKDQITSYLHSLAISNPSLCASAQDQILYDTSVIHSAHIRTAIVGTSILDHGCATPNLAPFVGPGMLAGLIVPLADHKNGLDFFDLSDDSQWRAVVKNLVGVNATSETLPEDLRPEIISVYLGRARIQSSAAASTRGLCMLGPKLASECLTMADVVQAAPSNDGKNPARTPHEGVQPENLDSDLTSASAGLVLVLKICGALAAWGYKRDTVANVANLVAYNLMTAVSSDMDGDGVMQSQDSAAGARRVGQMLKTLLERSVHCTSPKAKRTRQIQYNSNELVLLINNGGDVDEITFGMVVTETIQQLHNKWNKWPVRIYAGRYAEAKHQGFSISLLNVVNTDIGGPSMIQLLDAPCDAQGWNAYARKETWDGRNMLSREDKEPVRHSDSGAQDHASATEAGLPASRAPDIDEPETHEDNDREHTSVVNSAAEEDIGAASEYVDAAEPDTTESAEVTADPISENESATETFENHEAFHESSVDAEEVAPAPEPEVVTSLQELESSRPHIRHPTWPHSSGGESLLDLVQMQASRLELGDLDKSQQPAEESADAGEVEEAGKELGKPGRGVEAKDSASDEGFELV